MANWLDKYEQGGLVLKKKTKDNFDLKMPSLAHFCFLCFSQPRRARGYGGGFKREGDNRQQEDGSLFRKSYFVLLSFYKVNIES